MFRLQVFDHLDYLRHSRDFNSVEAAMLIGDSYTVLNSKWSWIITELVSGDLVHSSNTVTNALAIMKKNKHLEIPAKEYST